MSTLSERLDGLPPERRQRVEERTQALIATLACVCSMDFPGDLE